MKNIIRHLFLLCALALLLPVAAAAQHSDSRQRTSATIVADGLAQLPAAKVAVFDRVMGELTALGSDGVERIAGMLTPASEGKNATLEYALSGMVAYATAPGHESRLEGVRAGLLASLARCTDPANRVFLLSQLQLCATAADAPALVSYLDDPDLMDGALRALISIPGSEQVLLAEAAQSNLSPGRKQALAYAFGEKRMTAAEPVLLGWLVGADPQTTAAVYAALARCGGVASLKVLGTAAATVRYADEVSGVTAAYLGLLAQLAQTPQAQAVAVQGAKKLLKSDLQYVRGAGLAILASGQGTAKTLPYVLDAVKKGPAEYRFAALESLGRGDDALFAAVAKGMPRYDVAAQAAVVTWLGDQGAVSQADVIARAVASPDAQVARAAIESAGRVGGASCLAALVEALSGDYRAEAMQGMLSFRGDVGAAVLQLLQHDDRQTLVPALQLAAARHMTAVGDRVFVLLNSADAQVRAEAFATLPFVVTTVDADRLASLLDGVAEESVPQVQAALAQAVKALAPDAQYTSVVHYMESSTTPGRYYPLLAHSGTQQAVEVLVGGLGTDDRDAAFAALLTVENPMLVDILYDLASKNPTMTDRALSRYVALVAAQDLNPANRYQLYRRALEIKPSASVRGQLLGALSDVHILAALVLASDYLTDAEVAPAAAAAVKIIAAKSSPALEGAQVAAALRQARDIYTALSKADPDAGYAANEITEQLSRLAVAPLFELAADEQARGYEVLFDGRSLEKWKGNTVDYVPQQGAICVSAEYGGSGNLYTLKEYGDFNLRFEFRFMSEGVNNGIGIRTREGADAAYDGMEIQVLDHDAPIYQGLMKYQQHGSVYGILPAKRVRFGELKTWHTMEINAVGDRITVTVNGEKIVDGNIREACRGHNVSPDGSDNNSYTVDHQNHPGLFNKRGPISFCGHGPGIQYRHVRVLDLDAKAVRK